MHHQLAMKQLGQYWKEHSEAIYALPFPKLQLSQDEELPPRFSSVILPEWARDLGVEGALLIPSCLTDKNADWQQTDWLSATFWYVNCLAEQAYEKKHGPIHSYSLCLTGWDERHWQYAWANRIALFLRRWAARFAGKNEAEFLGDKPRADIIITHDVDALELTIPIRLKQTAFHVLNFGRLLFRKEFKLGCKRLQKGCKFFFTTEHDWAFEHMLALEKKSGIVGFYLFSGSESPSFLRSFKRWLFDPFYDPITPSVAKRIQSVAENGMELGVHPSFESWNNRALLTEEFSRLASIVAHSRVVRQHWLRFSFEKTWKAQQEAGFEVDFTLGFNDRFGFRNGGALKIQPWNMKNNGQLNMYSIPLILMDSHLYDYSHYSKEKRQCIMQDVIDEVKFVGGIATVLWHPHTLSREYSWGEGFKSLLEMIKDC